jgi:hypothetical protein
MPTRRRSTARQNTGYAIVCLVGAAVFLAIGLSNDDRMRDDSELIPVQGRVLSFTKNKRSISFQLAGRGETFVYSSRGWRANALETAFSASDGAAVSLLVDPKARSHWLIEEPLIDVWQISVHDRMVDSAQDTRSSRQRDNVLGYCIVVAFVLASVYFTAMARRIRHRGRRFRRARQPAD